MESCPLIEFPSHAPACSTITSMFQDNFRGLGKFRRSDRRKGVSRMQAEQVVYMAVFILWIINILRPFHQLTITAYLIRSEFFQHFFPLFAFFFIYAQYFRCINGVQKDFTDNGMNESSPLVYWTMLRWSGWSRCISSVRLLPKIVHGKLGATLDKTITGFL